MKIESHQYIFNQGWITEPVSDLDSDNTLVLVFASPIFKKHPQVIQQLATLYSRSKIMGCSTAGEIFGSKILDNSLAIAVIQFERTQIRLVKAMVKDNDSSYSAGETIAEELMQPDLRNIFILSDGLNVNGSELVKGLNRKSNPNILISGGLAADGADFKDTWVIFNGEIFQHHAVAVGFYGEHICVGHASKGGWDIFGPERRITRSHGNILYELDNRPALSLYKEYLGELASQLPSSGLLYPLAIRNPADPESKPLVRTILNIDESNQSLIFAGDMPNGYFAQLMRANFDRLITSASEAGATASHCHSKDGLKQSNGLVVAIDISCVGRRLIMGERTEEETEATFDALSPGSIQIGFYSYGELSPIVPGSCELHNQTMTITTWSE